MKQMHIAHLQQEIVQVFGQPILSFSDCTRLAETIFEKTGLKISVNTLRRFFNLITAKYPPSHNTLNILAKACGYQTYSEFVQLWGDKVSRPQSEDGALLKYMVSLFQQMPVPGIYDETFNHVVHLTITYLRSNEDIVDGFQKKIARTKNGQDFYFERFIHLDALAHFYGNGLRYYLNEKKDPAAQVFGHSLLCLRAWLTMDIGAFENHFKQLRQYKMHPSMPHMVQACYISAQLLHAQQHQQPVEVFVEEARHIFQQFSHSKENLRGFPDFEWILSCTLVLTGQCEEALYYISQVNKKRVRYTVVEEEKPRFKGFDVFELLACAALGKRMKAEALYQVLQKGGFYFLEQKFFSLLLMRAELLLKKRKFRDEKFNFLVEETGFAQLRTLYQINKIQDNHNMSI